MNKKSRIVIAEDHMILREGLRSLLSSISDFEIVGEAEDSRMAIQCVEKYKPDLNGPLHVKDEWDGCHQGDQKAIRRDKDLSFDGS